MYLYIYTYHIFLHIYIYIYVYIYTYGVVWNWGVKLGYATGLGLHPFFHTWQCTTMTPPRAPEGSSRVSTPLRMITYNSATLSIFAPLFSCHSRHICTTFELMQHKTYIYIHLHIYKYIMLYNTDIKDVLAARWDARLSTLCHKLYIEMRHWITDSIQKV